MQLLHRSRPHRAAWVLAGALALVPLTAAAAPLPPYPAVKTPFGVNRAFDYSEEQAKLQRLDPAGVMAVVEGRDLQYVNELGVRHYRVQPNEFAGFAWDRMDAKHAGRQVDFSRTDALVKVAQRNGINVLPVLAPYADPAAEAEAGRTYLPARAAARDALLAAYGTWVRQVVERYDGDGTGDMPGLRWPIAAWQVDVTPDRTVALAKGAYASTQDYIAVLGATAAAVHGAAPEAHVVLGAVSSASARDKGLALIDAVLASPAAGQVDVMAFEFLPRTVATGELRDAVAAMRARAGDRPLWCTLACAYSRYTPRNAMRDRATNEATQAATMVRRYSYMLGNGVNRIYEARITEAGPESWKLRTFYSGLRNHDGSPKMAYSSYRLIVRLLGPVDFPLTKMVRDGEQDLVVLRFRREDSDRLLYVLWWDYASTAQYKAGQLEPDIATQVTLRLTDEHVEIGEMVQNAVGRFQTAVVKPQEGTLNVPLRRVPVMLRARMAPASAAAPSRAP